MNKISVIGGGTAGLSASYLLSSISDNQVTLFEKNKKLGWRYDGCVQSIRNYESNVDIIDFLFKNGFRIPSKIFHPIFKQIRIFPNNEEIIFSSTEIPSFYNILRGTNINSFDSFMAEEIRHRDNCKIILNKPINVNFLEDSDYTIIAKGSNGIKKGKEFSGIEYHGFSNNYPLDTIVIILDNNIIPSGYIYILPFQNKNITIGAGWNTKLYKLNNERDLLQKILNKSPKIKYLLSDFELVNHLRVYARGGFINKPFNNTYFIGESFGALEAGLGFGNINTLLTSIAVQKSIENNDRKIFLSYLYNNDIINNILLGKYRRFFIDKCNNEYYNQQALNLIKKYGRNIDYADYRYHKKKNFVNTKLFKSLSNNLWMLLS